jgi:uracil phosphoribosyltransferase
MGSNESMESSFVDAVANTDIEDGSNEEVLSIPLLVEKSVSVSKIEPAAFNPMTVVVQGNALKHLFTKLRNVTTNTADFVHYSRRIMTLLVEEVLAELPSEVINVRTPCGSWEGTHQIMDWSEVCAVSIVRSGDALIDVIRNLVPQISVGKILIQRNEEHPDKIPTLLYSKLPQNKKYILLCDPMLATGGSATMALDVLTVRYKINPRNIVFVNVISCPEGLEALAKSYPRVKIVTAMVDSHLNADKFIVPGLGDFGDRYYGTDD